MINYNNDDVEIIMKQTNYTYNQACEKLSEHDFDKLKVIREYLGILPKTEKNTPIKSINQEIYKQIRTELDTVMSNYNKKNPLNTVLLYKGIIILKINEKLYRPAEVDLLYGDSNETRKAIGWEPKVSFQNLVKKMIEWDINLLKK